MSAVHFALESSLLDMLETEADWFAGRLSGLQGAVRQAVPDYGMLAREKGTLARPVTWSNMIVSTPVFRRAHVELFAISDQIAVLHVCLFPHPGLGLPIFGFDAIAGQAKMTGGFLDLSPVGSCSGSVSASWAKTSRPERELFLEPRLLPSWGDIFSPDVVAVRPASGTEVARLFSLGRDALDWLINEGPRAADPLEELIGQRRYIQRQRSNDHTFRMLKSCVGEDLARDFVDAWLFPDPGTE